MLEVCTGLSQGLHISLSLYSHIRGDIRGTLVGHQLSACDKEREGSTYPPVATNCQVPYTSPNKHESPCPRAHLPWAHCPPSVPSRHFDTVLYPMYLEEASLFQNPAPGWVFFWTPLHLASSPANSLQSLTNHDRNLTPVTRDYLKHGVAGVCVELQTE